MLCRKVDDLLTVEVEARIPEHSKRLGTPLGERLGIQARYLSDLDVQVAQIDLVGAGREDHLPQSLCIARVDRIADDGDAREFRQDLFQDL